MAYPPCATTPVAQGRLQYQTRALPRTSPCDVRAAAPIIRLPNVLGSEADMLGTATNAPETRSTTTAEDTLKRKTRDANVVSGGHLVAKALKNEGVATIFTLCGGHIIDIYDGCIV